jgi:alpha-glucosidase
MKKNKPTLITLLIMAIVIITAACSTGHSGLELKSPDGQLRVELSVEDSLQFVLQYRDSIVITLERMGFRFEEFPDFGKNLSAEIVNRGSENQQWEPIGAKNSPVIDHYNYLTVALTETLPPYRKMDMEFRLYDEGLGFRYRFYHDSQEKLIMTDEFTQFQFHAAGKGWVADYVEFTTGQEAQFIPTPFQNISPESLIGLPFVSKTENNLYVAITEANLRNYPGMYLSKADENSFKVRLAPLPGELKDGGKKAHITDGQYSPFRVIMVADSPGAFIESNIIMNLADPTEYEDTSWIKPGICVWDSWWSRGVQMDTQTVKKFIDFASYMGYPYQQIDWQWYGDPFKVADPDYIPADNVDITTWIPEIDLPHILEYAKGKNIGIWLWLLSHHADAQMEEAFALYQQWGVVGVKIDFMERDDQEMVLWYENTLRLAAKYNLMVNFHGNYKPTGVERTFPNLMAREGVLGNEYNIWSDQVTPEHNVTIPFTRMVAGQMDYTPGGFLNVGVGEFTPGYPTQVMGTRCHELAKFVVYFSPLTFICDNPENYYGQPGLDFLKEVPTVSEEYKVLAGEIGEYLLVARKKDNKWYIGAMTNSQPRTITLDLGLIPGLTDQVNLRIWKDEADADVNPTHLIFEEMKTGRDTKTEIQLAPGGGYVAIIE